MQTKQTDLARLLMGTKVFVVPQFQRHYKWKPSQWQELWDDIIEQYRSPDVQNGRLAKDEGHFLGSVVLHPTPGPASTVSKYWVIDGQQRLSTLMVLISALRDYRESQMPEWNPNEYTNLYLSNQYNPDNLHRLVLGASDREDFVSTVYEKHPAGQVGEAYVWFYRAIERAASESTIDFEKLQNAILLRLILVEINTSEDDNINQIFNTINHSGLRLSAIDLIRNHSFMQFDSTVAEKIYESVWKPMEDRLGEDQLTLYLWAQLVRDNPKATQRDLYGPFQAHLERTAKNAQIPVADATERELVRLNQEVDTYLLATNPTAFGNETAPLDIRKVLSDLSAWGSQTYIPIALEIISQYRSGSCDALAATTALRHVLSYLVRRGLSGIPTNNLNRILSSIPYSVRGKSAVDKEVAIDLLNEGRYWPNDSNLIERGTTTPISVTLRPHQVLFILAELNDSLQPKEAVSRIDLSVEHIMPRALTPGWEDMLAESSVPAQVAESRLNVIGNLTVTGSNSELARRSPSEKAAMLRKSNLPLNREFPPSDPWIPESIDSRSLSLLKLCIEVWPRPVAATATKSPQTLEVEAATRFDVGMVLDALPATAHVLLAQLAELVADTESHTIEMVIDHGYSIFTNLEGEGVVGGMRDLSESEVLKSPQLTLEEIIDATQSLGSDVISDEL